MLRWKSHCKKVKALLALGFSRRSLSRGLPVIGGGLLGLALLLTLRGAHPPAGVLHPASSPGPSPLAAPLPPQPHGDDLMPKEAFAVRVDQLAPPIALARVSPPDWRRDPVQGTWRFDPAYLLHAPAGTPVGAAGPGLVHKVRPHPLGGQEVVVQHAGGLTTLYKNLTDVVVQTGQRVSTYARLGAVPDGDLGGAHHIRWQVLHQDEPVFLDSAWINQPPAQLVRQEEHAFAIPGP